MNGWMEGARSAAAASASASASPGGLLPGEVAVLN